MGEGQFRDSNRRSHSRTAIRQPATVTHGETTVAVQTLDVGAGGMCLLARRPVAPGTRCSATFELPLPDGPVEVTVPLRIVYSSYLAPEQFKIGALFSEPDAGAAEAIERFTAASS